MIVVLDASGAVEITERTKCGVDFFSAVMDAERVMAPDLYVAEIANIMWKHGRKEKDKADKYAERAQVCIDYIDEYISSIELWEEALRLAQEYDHSVYDMLYATLSRRHNATLITMDRGLRQTCLKIPVRCKEIVTEAPSK